MTREVINPEGLSDSTEFGYNQLIVDDDTIYMSGQPGWDSSFTVAGADVTSQTQQAFDNVERLLDAVDKEMDDIVKVTCYLVDAPENLEEFVDVWTERFEEPRPCRTIVGVDTLASADFLVEIDVEAIKEE